MTKQELNRDAKRLINRYKNNLVHDEKHNVLSDFEKEFKRIYFADSNFEYLKPEYALCMHRINQSLRLIPLHSFGIGYKIK
jgi:hypothetical protein